MNDTSLLYLIIYFKTYLLAIFAAALYFSAVMVRLNQALSPTRKNIA